MEEEDGRGDKKPGVESEEKGVQIGGGEEDNQKIEKKTHEELQRKYHLLKKKLMKYKAQSIEKSAEIEALKD